MMSDERLEQKIKIQTTLIADQIQTALNEILAERGLSGSIEIDLSGDGVNFIPKDIEMSNEFFEEIFGEAVVRTGGSIADDENGHGGDWSIGL